MKEEHELLLRLRFHYAKHMLLFAFYLKGEQISAFWGVFGKPPGNFFEFMIFIIELFFLGEFEQLSLLAFFPFLNFMTGFIVFGIAQF